MKKILIISILFLLSMAGFSQTNSDTKTVKQDVLLAKPEMPGSAADSMVNRGVGRDLNAAKNYPQAENNIKSPLLPFDLALGLSASTNGFGVNLITSLNKYFAVRVAYENVNMTFNNAFAYKQSDRNLDASPTWKTGGLSAILDVNFYPGLYLSAGVVSTAMNMKIKFSSKDPLQFGDITFAPNELGEMVLSFKPSRKLAPYAAIGLGRNITRNKRVAFSTEFGAYFMKTYIMDVDGSKIFESNGDALNQSTIDNVNNELSNMKYKGVFPVFKMALSYRFITGKRK